MENKGTTMELNNEAVINDTVETTDVNDTVFDPDEVIIAEVDSGDAFKTFVKIVCVGAAAITIAVVANWDKIQEKRYEKLMKKAKKEAEKRGEIVYVTKANSDEDEDVEEFTDEDVCVEENED